MNGIPRISPAPTILTGVREVSFLFLLANFQEVSLISASLIPVFAKFWNPLYKEGNPCKYPVLIILRKAEDFVKHCVFANFRESISNFASFISIFVKFWTPLYVGGNPSISTAPTILTEVKEVAKPFLLANFQEVPLTFARRWRFL